MQQIKLFKGLEGELSNLEREINHWIAENHIKVLQIEANIAPQGASTRPAEGGAIGLGKSFVSSDVLVVVLYEKS